MGPQECVRLQPGLEKTAIKDLLGTMRGMFIE